MALRINPKYSNIARPYAGAAFEYAKDKQQLSEWKVFLERAAEIVRMPQIVKLLTNPDVSYLNAFNLLHDTLAPFAVLERKNFLMLLAKNQRLLLLPEITALFNTYQEAYEKSSQVRVITAIKIEEDFRSQLTNVLTHRLQRAVTLHCEVDPSILGGAVIHIGDRVIDGSIRGKLTRLLEFSLR